MKYPNKLRLRFSTGRTNMRRAGLRCALARLAELDHLDVAVLDHFHQLLVRHERVRVLLGRGDAVRDAARAAHHHDRPAEVDEAQRLAELVRAAVDEENDACAGMKSQDGDLVELITLDLQSHE